MKPERYPWRALAGLLLIAAVALLLSFPFPPPPAAYSLGILVLAGVTGAGLLAARAGDLDASLLARPSRDAGPRAGALRSLAVGAGAGAALGVVSLAWIALAPGSAMIRARFASEHSTPALPRLILAFDSAVLEELGFRLLLVSLLVWTLARAPLPSRRWSGDARARLAIAVVALGFGLAHAPKWLATAPATAGLLASIVILNATGGLVFGALYWGRGIESAMLGHFAANAILHVLGPTLLALKPA